MSWERSEYKRVLGIGAILLLAVTGGTGWGDIAETEHSFRTLSRGTREACGPLFWLHGDESREKLETCLERVAESGCGTFTAESRPHSDWLGEGWYRDLSICLEKAKKLGLSLWIYDDYWWPSQMMGGRVPGRYGAKKLAVREERVAGKIPCRIELGELSSRLIGVVAGRRSGKGIDPLSLVDLSPLVRDGRVIWTPPEGRWDILAFFWRHVGKKGSQKNFIAVDGADRACVEWFIKTVYEPHYRRFKEDFGRTIRGFFYDEPETPGDWGPELMEILKERGIDWKLPFLAWAGKLEGEVLTSARYQYADAFAEAWGRTLYGALSAWCAKRGVDSIGHLMEHGNELFSQRLCAGNYMSLMKYSHMAGIDLVCHQFYPGQRREGYWQMAKLASSTAHCYGMKDDRAMCEIFGGYGQALTYPQMKGLIDQMQARGVSYMVPHSFNPRAPRDLDFPPYFYNGGEEPRYPLFKVLADYSCRLSLMLQGGHHVADVAFLFPGQSFNAGKCVKNDRLTDALDDALLDCDWMPYEVFEQRCGIGSGGKLHLRGENYRILILPQVEVIPYGTLEKARTFFEAGGIVAAYGALPSASATIGKGRSDIARLCADIWGSGVKPGLSPCRMSRAGGRAYFLPASPTPAMLRRAFIEQGGVVPAGDVPGGVPGGWLKILHRVKEEGDRFFISDQRVGGTPRTLGFRLEAEGVPELWRPMDGSVEPLRHVRRGEAVTLDLTLEAGESLFVVFRRSGSPKEPRSPLRIRTWPLEGRTVRVPRSGRGPAPFEGLSWVWGGTGNPLEERAGTRLFFRKTVEITGDRLPERALFRLTCDNSYRLYVNGKVAARDRGSGKVWTRPGTHSVASLLRKGKNVLAIEAQNGGDEPNPAGLIGWLELAGEEGEKRIGIDGSWKVSANPEKGWTSAGFSDRSWAHARVICPYGGRPWGRRCDGCTVSPVPFLHFDAEITLPPCPAGDRFWLEAEGFGTEDAARITVNGEDAGGFIGKPCRIEISRWVKDGVNKIRFEPFIPILPRIVLER